MNPAFDGNFVQLVRKMDGAAREIDKMPDDQELTQDELAAFEDVRHAALGLAAKAEALIEDFNGKGGK